MDRRRHIIRTFASALIAGPWKRRSLQHRARSALGPRASRRASRIVDDILAAHEQPYPPHRGQLERLLRASAAFNGLSEATIQHLLVLPRPVVASRFEPIGHFKGLTIPALATTSDLADWLSIPLAHLDWLADNRRTLAQATEANLQHYTHSWTPKRTGWRLIEAPKPRLRDIQRQILHDILDRMPVHNAAFGFVAGRNCTMAAAKHAGEHVVFTADLRDFFLNTPVQRVHAVFRCLGYPWGVARLLTGLCTTSTPRTVLNEDRGRIDHSTRQRYVGPHLPQGAPTSPALANLVSHRLDTRLSGLADRFDAHYTRYADDLTFSGDETFHAAISRFRQALATIVADEGHALNPVKTRIMPRQTRQSVTGIVVNDHINVARPDYDALKATLTNCARHGPTGQDRDGHADFRAHLDGRITWVERVNLRRGEKLRRIFDTIVW